MPRNLGLLKTKRGKATLPLPSACRIEFLSSFHFPPWATPCLVDVKVYVFPLNAPDEALATKPTTIAAASVMVPLICDRLYPRPMCVKHIVIPVYVNRGEQRRLVSARAARSSCPARRSSRCARSPR